MRVGSQTSEPNWDYWKGVITPILLYFGIKLVAWFAGWVMSFDSYTAWVEYVAYEPVFSIGNIFTGILIILVLIIVLNMPRMFGGGS